MVLHPSSRLFFTSVAKLSGSKLQGSSKQGDVVEEKALAVCQDGLPSHFVVGHLLKMNPNLGRLDFRHHKSTSQREKVQKLCGFVKFNLLGSLF